MSSKLSAPFEVIQPKYPGKPLDLLFQELNQAAVSKSKRGKVRKNDYQLWTNPDIKITGWKYNEWDYGKESIKLAINARGLFSYTDPKTGKESIVVRGYDKFFNINEVPMCNWDWIGENSKGPYYVTSKENGCIVFISGMEDGTLIVTSKQSTGPRLDSDQTEQDRASNHSYVSQKWVEKHLDSKGIDHKEFAKLLHSMNVTAVGELCDDSFEEHVLAYPSEEAGIYLHGLNVNVPTFTTYPFEDVQKFAEKFGFRQTKYLVIQTIKELREFLEKCAETGTWNNKDVEGFVIRCKANIPYTESGIDSGVEPSTACLDYFFKYKFEEPYLMYRQWRELTKAFLSGTPRQDLSIKKNIYYTNLYLNYAIELLSKDTKLREDYLHNHGIIKVRQMFLDSIGCTGSEIIQKEAEMSRENGEEELDENGNKKLKKQYVLVPVSTIGCGKTTIGIALTHLFPRWGHIQNDDIKKTPKPIHFARYCSDVLKYATNTVAVFADRNNHKCAERKQLFTDMDSMRRPGTQNVYIGLNFRPDTSSEEKIWELTTKRVTNRGDNHQTIAASSDDQYKVMGIMKGFVNRFQPVNTRASPDDQFDLVIDLDSTTENSSRTNLEIIVNKLYENYPELVPELPTKSDFDSAFKKALEYKPEQLVTGKGGGSSEKKRNKLPSYFGIEINPLQSENSANNTVETLTENLSGLSIFESKNATIPQLIDEFFKKNPEADTSTWELLKKNKRVQETYHVTLVHKKQGNVNSNDKKAQEVYKRYQKIFESAPSDCGTDKKENTKKDSDGFQVVGKPNKNGNRYLPGLEASVEIKKICWNNELMVFEVEIHSADSSSSDENLVETVNPVAHITIGTISPSIPAVKAGQALAGAKNSNSTGGKLTKYEWNIEPKVLKSQKVAAYY